MERSQDEPLIVFDIGGVLVPSEGALTGLAGALSVDVETLEGPYWQHRDSYDRGGSPEGFWGPVLGALGQDASPRTIRHLDDLDARRWSTIDDAARLLLADLDAAGLRTAALSNAPVSLARMVGNSSWSRGFSALMFSSEVGVLKPDPEVFHLADERFGCSASVVLFFDDRPANVAAADDHGWSAVRWTGAPRARRALAESGLLPWRSSRERAT